MSTGKPQMPPIKAETSTFGPITAAPQSNQSHSSTLKKEKCAQKSIIQHAAVKSIDKCEAEKMLLLLISFTRLIRVSITFSGPDGLFC